MLAVGGSSCNRSKCFGPKIGDQIIYPGGVTGRSAETLDEADLDWIGPGQEDNRGGLVAAFAANDFGRLAAYSAANRPP